MEYKVFEPGEPLHAFIKCYWTLEFPEEKEPDRQRIVPDGCMEMIFHLGDLYRQYLDRTHFLVQPRSFVIGQLTEILEIEPTGETNIFSVRFHPEGFLPFATIPLKELENTAVSLEKLFGEEGAELEQDILKALDTPERIRLVDAFLTKRLSDSETIDRVVQSIVETILTANGRLSMTELSEKLRVNRRQLERKCSAVIGLSPKQLSRIVRLQSVLKQMINNEFTNLSDLAYDSEYFDQAHFIKDFKEFTGFTPKEFYGENLKMSALFYGMG